MKKIIISTLLLFSFILPFNVFATEPTTIEEHESLINQFEERKNYAHQMAEAARALGYTEDHTIITTAQSEWWTAHNAQTDIQKKLDDLKASEAVTFSWAGSKLTKSKGVNYGPSGKETYYNLPMGGVVRIMRNRGFSEAEYPYWVRQDGVKMLGDYVICAANLSVHPRGSIVQTSLGLGIVCDTGGFAKRNIYQLDIATAW